MSEIVAVIAAHPDDEALGAAGTIAGHCAAGDTVHIVFMADGEGARGSLDNLDARRAATYSAADAMGVARDHVHFLDFPDNSMDSRPLLEIVQALEGVVFKIGPSIIYTHHHGDLNVDHRLTHQAVLTMCRPMPDSTVNAIYGFEVLSSTEWATPHAGNAFIPNHYVEITGHWNAKREALEAYADEMRNFPHARSLEASQAQAVLRGAHVGVEKAEAFTVIRQIQKS